MTLGEPVGAKHRRRAAAEAPHGLMVQLRRPHGSNEETHSRRGEAGEESGSCSQSTGRWAAATVDADRKAGSEPSTPSLETEGRPPRPRHWDTLGDGGSRHGQMGISCSTYYIKLHGDTMEKD